MRDGDEATMWAWTMSGMQPSRGTMLRSAEATGTLSAECAGEVFDELVQRGPWDMFDQDEEVTITVKPPRDAGKAEE
jgi:hypothetical protein